MQKYLVETEVVDFSHPEIKKLAASLSMSNLSNIKIAKNCFEYVRDFIHHTGDHKDTITTYKASDVLKHKTGWCYAKSHLLAALLRANKIPTGFCYQRLSCSEYKKDIFCLHGLNAIYLKNLGWYKVDPRGNKKGVNAQFKPPMEQLAFELKEHEVNIPDIYDAPLDIVVQNLKRNSTYNQMINDFPDIH